MSDLATPDRTASSLERGLSAELRPEGIDALLADFRAWILDLAGEGAATPSLEPQAAEPEPGPGADLFTLVSQFTALRHEVNMQTRAARAAVEQNAEVLRRIDASEKPTAGCDDATLRQVVKACIDINDALALSLQQTSRLRESAERLVADLGTPPPAPSFFARLFGLGSPAEADAQRTSQALDLLRQLIAAAADGYALSLRRAERLLPALELEPFTGAGDSFDPETMEVVEVVDAGNRPAGTVVECSRPGYRWRGKVFRFAQVKVAR